MGRVLKIRLCDEDRDEYGLPEWLELDRDLVDDMRADALHELEVEMDITIWQLFAVLATRSARCKRAVAWLAMQQAGSKVPWADFNPRILKARFAPGGDADPPDDGGTPSSGGPPAGGSPAGSTGNPSEGDFAD